MPQRALMFCVAWFARRCRSASARPAPLEPKPNSSVSVFRIGNGIAFVRISKEGIFIFWLGGYGRRSCEVNDLRISIRWIRALCAASPVRPS